MRKETKMPKIYLASPLGFSPELSDYLDRVKSKLTSLGYEVLNPWDVDYNEAFDKASLVLNHYDRARAFDAVAEEIGKTNEDMIRAADTLLAVLDGMEPDSGTCSELGFAAGLGKKVYGLRTDMRSCGDFLGPAVNLQVHWFIQMTGGELFRSIDEINLQRFLLD